MLSNNSGLFATTPNLVSAVQLILPGEVAVAHHHTPAALRIILESEGAYTCTDGERCWMEPGDVILTPAWTYHDHKNEGDKPAMWHRHSSVGIFHVFRGSGHTLVENKRLEWSAGDIFVIPGWHWHEHVNAARKEDAILISYTDEPLLKSLGIHREEADGAS